ncbi:uncharacterized protein CELE_ZC449.8 [Caenorhabditis elegans]|uniref:Uncharacterized protein n=1 Tax=Caenorhabditis elegans TaxID=6239 RepID=G4SLU9_CAEEL|nr:Uncharacterized protein CELE_ZC449.8 [Caenorhabditis elegans]CCD72339.1 Uncharacterized protein CELE_ZC449.8 [Caenorhabditis elegans]|eukprot:NP_001257016.1 Uncharacterized protein CELE_ZC449.8 [Caenorhabditis elegans]
MPHETKKNSLKRNYPDRDDDQLHKETEGVLTNVVSILKTQENQDVAPSFTDQSTVVKGSIPPPNTPCTKD